ncbi:MAG: ribonuclease P protein component [Candidatus Brocadiales bacterium]
MSNAAHINTDTRLKKAQRIKKRRDIEKVFEEGETFRGKNLNTCVLPNSLDFSRLAIVTGKRVGNAVERNRIRRLLRECFRLNKGLLGPGLDVVLIPRKGFPTTFPGAEEEFKRLAGRLKTHAARKAR